MRTKDDWFTLVQGLDFMVRRWFNGPDDRRPQWLKELPGATHPGEAYYAWFWALSLALTKSRMLEIGTRGGTTTLHVAAANPHVHVVTLDIEPGCKENVERIAREHGLTNVVAHTGDSTQWECPEAFDVLFIDGDHSYEAASSDYRRFRRNLVDGGLIVFDDTRLNEGMTRAWNEITDPKLELPELHYMGFGVAVKVGLTP